ncbi:hypothetical protein LEP1GSC040_0383 [Leptospira santarosai str. 2000030832]|nr:hypothetical protein LEP1GSC040_0383 [Leptospira santarosai str. 2000030832]
MPMRGNLRFLNILWDRERLTMEGTPSFQTRADFGKQNESRSSTVSNLLGVLLIFTE